MIKMATGTTSQSSGMTLRLSSEPPAATAPRSAPTLMVLAQNSARMHAPTSTVGNLRRSAMPRPTPVCRAMRAHSSCIAAISGKVKSEVHSRL